MGMYLKKDRESCIQGKRGKNTWGKEGPYIRGKARYIKGKEGEVYQGKGRGRISGVKKVRYIRGKEGEVY